MKKKVILAIGLNFVFFALGFALEAGLVLKYLEYGIFFAMLFGLMRAFYCICTYILILMIREQKIEKPFMDKACKFMQIFLLLLLNEIFVIQFYDCIPSPDLIVISVVELILGILIICKANYDAKKYANSKKNSF